MKILYRRLTPDQIAFLRSLVTLASVENASKFTPQEAAFMVDLERDLATDAPDLDALATEIHRLRNDLTNYKLREQMEARKGDKK